jgi:hypothetical protein
MSRTINPHLNLSENSELQSINYFPVQYQHESNNFKIDYDNCVLVDISINSMEQSPWESDQLICSSLLFFIILC